MFGINKNGTKEKIGILLPASYPSDKVTYGAGTVKDALDVVAYKNVANTFSEGQTIDEQDGTTATVGSSFLSLGNNTAEGVAKNSKGIIKIFGKGIYRAHLMATNMTGNREIELPDKNGTIALTTDISGYLVTEEKTIWSNMTLGANSATTVKTYDLSKSGYTPIAVSGFSFNGNNGHCLSYGKLSISGNTLNYQIANNGNSNATGVNAVVTFLYVKNS